MSDRDDDTAGRPPIPRAVPDWPSSARDDTRPTRIRRGRQSAAAGEEVQHLMATSDRAATTRGTAAPRAAGPVGAASSSSRRAEPGVRAQVNGSRATDGNQDQQRGRHESTEDDPDDLVIRPFLLTGGRTRPARENLHIETLIQARPGAMPAALRFEARQIVELCRQATSMAELSAALRVPLGVARVLVSDLVDDGSVSVVQREELSIQLIERIRDRVRAL